MRPWCADRRAGEPDRRGVGQRRGAVGHAGERGPLAAFWAAVRELDADAADESELAGVREGDLASLFTQAGLSSVQAGR